MTYDGNGNTLIDGVNTYTWDSRDQLSSIAGPVNASFAYDAAGRRQGKTIGSTATSYVYDVDNFVQEQNGAGSVTATWLRR